MKFFIQTICGEWKHDFSFHLLKSIEYLNWKDPSLEVIYEFGDEIPTDKQKYIGFCPIGSVEFVEGWYLYFHNVKLKPLNVPESLFYFAFRKIYNSDFIKGELVVDTNLNEVFVKSNDVTKYKKNGVYSPNDLDIKKLDDGNYQVSELKEIISEYRIFVFKNEILDIKLYSGEWDLFPNKWIIKKIVKSYENESPIAYTLDIGVNEKETFIIEVHDFYSCGLYGFNQLNRLPYMFWSSHLKKIN